jgi:hypothetical protein
MFFVEYRNLRYYHRFRVSENMELRGIFEYKIEEATESWRKQHNRELSYFGVEIFKCLQIHKSVQVKKLL